MRGQNDLGWRLKHVFNIDIVTCQICGGAVNVIACIEDPVVIEKLLADLNETANCSEVTPWFESRATLHQKQVL